MKKRILLVFCAIAALICILTLGTAAAIYETDNDGQYTIELDMDESGEYIMFVLKGEYDQTNYIEAFNKAADEDILYFEQKTSLDDGTVTFGPFVPNGYYGATVIVGGTYLDDPIVAGYLSVEGVSNTASITLSGIENSYTVKGDFGYDYVVEIESEVCDTFGYPCVTGEEVFLELYNNSEDISLDGNVLTIGKFAKEQVFTVVARAGSASKSVLVAVNRQESVARTIKFYSDAEYTDAVNKYEVVGVQGDYPSVTVYARTYDQYNDPINDSYTYVYYGEEVGATFTPKLGDVVLGIKSSNFGIVREVMISAKARPDYKESALELFNLINEYRAVLSADKNISVDGKEIFPEDKWTTQAAVDTFSLAISAANAELLKYGTEGYTDADYADEVTALTDAYATYNASFKAGVRKDVDTISIKEYDGLMTVNATLTLEAVTSPKIGNGLSNDVLTWTSSDDSVVSITSVTGSGNGKATIKGISSGSATITVTTRGGLTASAEITVIKKATDILLRADSTTAVFRGEPVVLRAQIKPTGCTDVITWTVDNPAIADLVFNEYIDDDNFRTIEATVVPKSAGKTKVTVNAKYGEESASKEITVVMPEWDTAAAPVASQEAGSVLHGSKVSLSCETEGTQIYYTLDGTEPSRTNGRLYKNPITINQTLTLKAIAVGDNLYDSEVVTYDYKVVLALVKATAKTARHGDYVDIVVSVEDFEDVKNAVVNVAFDNSALDLADVEYVCDYVDEDNSSSAEPNVVIALNYKEEGFSYSGDIAVLTFRVRDEAEEGEYTVEVSATDITKMDGTTFNAASSNGAVVVNDYILGDANNDGVVGLADVLLVKQYIMGNETASKNILVNAADVDVDGDVDEDDLTLISRYCVGWDVTFGPHSTVSDYRIISYYDLGTDTNDNWRKYYEVYDLINGTKVTNIPSVEVSDKASTLSEALEAGTVVKISADGTIDENNIIGKIDNSGLVWIKSMTDTSMVVVPVDETAECKNCVAEYVASFKEATYNDFVGLEQSTNVVKIDSNTKFVSMNYSEYNENFFKWATIRSEDVEDVKAAKKYVRCYNDKSEDREGNYNTTYSDYVKALVCTGPNGTAKFVIVIVNGDENAAYNIPCADCQ